MPDDRGFLSRLVSDVLNVGTAAREVLIERLPRGPRTVVLYDGFGANGRYLVLGRALRDEKLPPANASDTRWQNLWAMLRRADADPIARARVRIGISSAVYDVTADDEGFFRAWIDTRDAESARLDDDWIAVTAELASPDEDPPVRSTGRVAAPRVAPAFLVISDVDDTVLQSRATNLIAAAQTIAFGNARTRLPFPGVAQFYRALRAGPSATARNPLFYVSSSPWNLYDVITQFLEHQGIPAGPVILRDLDIDIDVLSSRKHHAHKGRVIREILDAFPSHPVVLIGDSGQQDPEIYRDIVRDYKGRVRAVYIRNVTFDDDRARAIQTLADEVLAAGSTLLLADDTLAAAKHAAEHGLIAPDSLADIEVEKQADEGTRPGKADAPGARDAGDAATPTVTVEKPD